MTMTPYFASEQAAGSGGGLGDIFVALGVNWQSLILNGLAFLVVVWVMAKFVYPVLVKALDAKRDELEAAAKSQQAAEEALAKAEKSAGDIVAEARASARELMSEAKRDASEMMKAAEAKASTQAERIAAEAREQLARDVEAARGELKAETAKLVVAATERIVSQKLDAKGDSDLVERSLEEAR